MNQAEANAIAQRIANFGASLGLSEATCLVHYVAPDWIVKTFCKSPADGKTYIKANHFKTADGDLEVRIEENGKLLMQSLQATFHTKH